MVRACNVKCIGGEDSSLQQVIGEAKFMEQTIIIGFSSSTQSQRNERTVTWHPSREDVVVLNVDGSASRQPGRAGFGDLLRRGDSEWLIGYYGSTGVARSLLAKMATLFFSLHMARLS